MRRIGIVGIGFMGMIHYLTYQKLRSAQVTGLCDPKPARLAGDWRDIQGNLGPPGRQMRLGQVFTTEHWQELIEHPDVDVVDICLPPALHPEVAIAAMRAGKAVFCEKPIALRPRDASQMVRVARETGQPLMIAHVLPMFPEYAWACKAVAQGRYGRLMGGSFRRVIADPTWLPDYYDPECAGGPMLDLHIHDAHLIRLLFGMPTHVTTVGRMRGSVAEYFSTQFRFPRPDLAVTATSGVIEQPGRQFLHGYELHFERATAVFEFAILDGVPRVVMPCTVIPEAGKTRRPRLGPADPMRAFEAELKAMLRGIRSGTSEEFVKSELALDALRICQKQTESLQKGTTVRL